MAASASATRIVQSIAVTALVAVALAITGHWLAFGIASWAVLMLSVAVGFSAGPSGAPRRILLSVAVMFALYSAMVVASALLEDPTGEPVLWMGLPRATAVLVYGIWPLGVLPAVLYLVEFSRSVLPADRLAHFRQTLERAGNRARAQRIASGGR